MNFMTKVLLIGAILAPIIICEMQLEMVIEMFRHGARAPINAAFDDKWVQWGELTPSGQRMHYIEGWHLRRKYPNVLPQNYNYTRMFVRSTNVNRTLQSAYSHALGQFDFNQSGGPELAADYPAQRAVPPFNTTTPIDSLGRNALPNRYQPIPTNNVDGHIDYTWQPSVSCPTVKKYWVEYENTTQWKNLSTIFEAKFPEIAQKFNIPFAEMNLTRAAKVFDHLVANYFENNQTAVVPTDDLWKTLDLINTMWITVTGQPNNHYLKLNVQPMFTELFKVIDRKINGTTPTMTWYTFSVHDLNLLAMLMAFKLTSLDCQIKKAYGSTDQCLLNPPYASLMLFEIWKDTNNNKRYVKMIYNEKEYSLCGGLGFCDYDKWKKNTRNELFVDNWFSACGLSSPNGPKYSTLFLVLFGALSVVIIILVIIIFVTKNKIETAGSMVETKGGINAPLMGSKSEA